MRAIQTFEVSLKAFIVRDGKALFVRESDTGYWELPGGRIDVGEEWAAHTVVLARELREELGPHFQVALHSEVVTWTRQRPTDNRFLFLVARYGEVTGSDEPVLSTEHDAYAWHNLDAARALHFPERSGYVGGIEALWRLMPKR